MDINDLTIVLTNYGKSTAMSWASGDFNNDGKVDINDLTIVLTNYDNTARIGARRRAGTRQRGLARHRRHCLARL